MGLNFSSKQKAINETPPVMLVLLDEGSSCCICLENYKMYDKTLTIMSCDHLFHENCVNDWFKFKKICPLCRYNVKLNEKFIMEEVLLIR